MTREAAPKRIQDVPIPLIDGMANAYIAHPTQPGAGKEDALVANGRRADMFRTLTRNFPEYAGPVRDLRSALFNAQAAFNAYGEGPKIRELYGPKLNISETSGEAVKNLLTDVLLSRLSSKGPGYLAADDPAEMFTRSEREAAYMRMEMGVRQGEQVTINQVMRSILSGRLQVLPQEETGGSLGRLDS